MYDNKYHTFEYQYNHKLFSHANRWGNDVIDYISELKPKIVKFLDPNLYSVQRVRELVPDGLLIYRNWKPEQPLGNSEAEAFQLGVSLGQEMAAETIVQQGLIDLVEGYNEILGETAPASEHRKFAKFQIGFKQGLGGIVEPIALNFGTGNMSANLIMTYYNEVLNSYKWLGFHEYDWPTMDRLHLQGLAEGNGGMWLALRYRRIMEPIIAAMGDRWSVIISECGMTQGVLQGQDVGFLNSENTIQGGAWGDYPTPISNDDYWQTLKWYSNELMRDDYVAGACMFVTGALSPWETFETIGTITPKIAEFQQEISNGGNMSDIFVNDVRANDDVSLALIPRIETFEELQERFGLDIDTTKGGDRANDGQRYWKLIGFEVRTGIAAYLTQVKNINGGPAADILVFKHWPDAPDLPSGVDPDYFSNAVGGFTDGNGIQGSPYSGGSVTGPDGGPDYIWLSSDPPGGTRIGSDMASKLGWIGGTDHLTANPIFQDTLKGGVLPPIGDSRLVVYDQTGNEVGYTPLLTGSGSGGRIALVTDGQEQSYVELES